MSGPVTKRLDPVTLSVMASALAGIADEMGSLLIRSAYSSNIKERRDCSAALFDGAGRMVAQAEHIPVHLGAMPETVRAVMGRDPQPDEVFVVNDPYSGGSHLPDVTLVSVIAYEGEIIGYGVTRAHHSDVGGSRPGSMPSGSREIYQEGLIIPPVRLVAGGEYVDDVLDLILANVRTPEIRRGDFRAQIAANRLAGVRLAEIIEKRGLDTVLAAFDQVIEYTERRTREAIRRIPDGCYQARDQVEGDGITDDDIPIVVSVTVADDEVTIDFSETADATPGNVNCPLAVTKSACYFAIKTLVPKDVPSNAGAFSPIEVIAPVGSLVNAQRPSAVVAANVETSSRIADTVLLALSAAADVPAQGQGTMNVLVIGSPHWTYIETLGGGQGASRRGPGSSGIHVGMTNTLNTPIEALELEYPLRVERYELRAGSGGSGIHDGGDGLVRSIRALEPASVSILSDRRRHPPMGSHGGGAGATGRNLVDDEVLPAKVNSDLEKGQVVIVETPGGGGWGQSTEAEPEDEGHR